MTTWDFIVNYIKKEWSFLEFCVPLISKKKNEQRKHLEEYFSSRHCRKTAGQKNSDLAKEISKVKI